MLDLRGAVTEMNVAASTKEIAGRVALECLAQNVRLDQEQFKRTCGRLAGYLLLRTCYDAGAVAEGNEAIAA